MKMGGDNSNLWDPLLEWTLISLQLGHGDGEIFGPIYLRDYYWYLV